MVYHIALRSDWDACLGSRTYAPSASPIEGVVVCAEADEYVAIANRAFSGRGDVLLLFIDTHRLDAGLRRTTAHDVPVLVYPAPLPTEAVFEIAELPTNEASQFVAHHETAALSTHGDDTFAEMRERALRAVGGWSRPWWIAGGWALDLYVGAPGRPHADLELSILSSDQRSLHSHLRGWDLRAVAPGAQLVPWGGEPLAPPYHQIWARRSSRRADSVAEFASDPTMLDFLIEDHVGDEWRYRRDHRVSRPVRDFGSSRDDLPFVRPEIALLYKAKQPRYKDLRDFRRVAPTLTSEQRAWLRAAIDAAHPHSESATGW